MDYQTVIEKTYEVVDALKSTDEYQELLNLKSRINEDLKDLIAKFKESEEKYIGALKYGNYHPDLKKFQVEFSNAKTQLFSNELVVRYKELERTIEKNINEVVSNLVGTISNKIKTSSWLNKK